MLLDIAAHVAALNINSRQAFTTVIEPIEMYFFKLQWDIDDQNFLCLAPWVSHTLKYFRFRFNQTYELLGEKTIAI